MFSRIKSSSRKEIRSVFRSIFGDTQPNSSPPSSPQKRKIKSSFSKRLRSRLTSIKLPGRQQSTPDQDGIYSAIDSPKYDFALSSILKKNRPKNKRKRSIRFEGSSDHLETTMEEMDTTKSIDSIPDKVPDQSDIDYYTKMKEELLNRSLELEMKRPLKRKASTIESPSKIKKTSHEPFDLKLKKWPHNDASLFIDDSASDNDIFYANYEGKKFSGKLVTLKMMKEQRFNPSQRESYCRLSTISDMSSRMSMCSA